VPKLGRKICCNFNKDVKCILLVKGHKHCVFDETIDKQREKGEQQLGVCALLPQNEQDNILTQIQKEKVSSFRSWKN
jgi:hypothetical protein